MHRVGDVGDRRFQRQLHRDHLHRHQPLRADVRRLPLQLLQDFAVGAAGHHPEEAVGTGDRLADLERGHAVGVQLDELAGLAEQGGSAGKQPGGVSRRCRIDTDDAHRVTGLLAQPGQIRLDGVGIAADQQALGLFGDDDLAGADGDRQVDGVVVRHWEPPGIGLRRV